MKNGYWEKDIKNYRFSFLILNFIFVVFFLLFIYLRTADIDLPFAGTSCYISSHFHIYCPGCGGTRAVLYLLEGDLIDSFLMNPIPIHICIIMIRVWCTLLYNCTFELRGRTRRNPGFIPLLTDVEIWLIPILPALIFIARNILLIVFHVDLIGDLSAYYIQ